MSDLDLSNSISIIGKESQTMQIVLKKNDKININKQYIFYASSDELDEIIYSKVDSLLKNIISPPTTTSFFSSKKKEERLKKVDNPSIVRLKNKNDNFEYVGLSMGGKIMKIIPILYTNLYVKVDNVLAFNEGVELLQDKERDERINKIFQTRIFGGGVNIAMGVNPMILGGGVNGAFNNKKQFCLIKTKFINSNNNNNFGDNQLNNDDKFSADLNLNQYSNDGVSLLKISSYTGDYLYLSGKKNLIEKRLGDNESMVLMFNSLVAFESSVSFNLLKKEQKSKYVNYINDIVAEGPGLVIFEQSDRPLPLINPARSYKLIVLILILLVIEVLIQLFITNNLFENIN